MAYPGNQEQQEEEGVAAFRQGIKDDIRAAESIVLHKFPTVQQCVEAVSDLERFRHGSGKGQPGTRLRQLEGDQAGAQSQGKTSGPSGQQLPSPSPVEQAMAMIPMILDQYFRGGYNMGQG